MPKYRWIENEVEENGERKEKEAWIFVSAKKQNENDTKLTEQG